MSTLSLSLLGQLAVTVDNKPFYGLRFRPTLALFIYLACRPERHRREHLMALLWPDWPAASAQQNLRQNLYVLRQALPEVTSKNDSSPVPLLLVDRDTLQINPEADVVVDALRFTSLLERPQPSRPQLAKAVALYRGEFLADFYLPDSEPFEEWATAWRADLQERMLEALDSLAAGALERSGYGEALAYARRQLEIDNLRESAHRQCMLALAYSGQRTSALAHYEICRRLLRDELGIEPSAETRALAERIAADEEVGNLPEVKLGRSSASPRHNLPLPLSSFVGRQKQLDDLVSLLSDPTVQLITITGLGGIGKTRLAQEAARRSADMFRHGVYFVSLESARTGDEVFTWMMDALGVRSDLPISQDEAVLNLLRKKHVLLVLDTLEHLPPVVDIVSRIRENVPDVKIMTTSRSPLRLSGEHLFIVPPLTVSVTASDPDEITKSDAMALFEARARETQPDFIISANNAADVVEICRLLGGLPLALEMAAAHARTLSLRQLRKQLGEGIDLLVGGPRDTPHRHQNIYDTLNWTYQLLSTPQKSLFISLSIFPEGCTLAAAEAVAPESVRQQGHFVDHLSALVDHSLVQVQTINSRRIYCLHEITRHFARDQLVASGNLDETCGRLLEYITGLAEQVNIHFRDRNRIQWLGLFEPEDRHVWLVLDWGLTTDNVPTVARCLALTGYMLQYWFIRGQHELARQWTDRALDCASKLDIENSVQGPALITASSLALVQADIDDSLRYAEAALRIAQETGDSRLEVRSRHLMGLCAFARAELGLADELWTIALTQAEQIGETNLLTSILDDMGNLAARRGDYDQAIEFHLREQDLSLGAGDLYSEFYASINLGEVSMLMERLVDAESYYQRALKICRKLGDSRGLAQTMIVQASLLVKLQRLTEAKKMIGDALNLAWAIQNLDIVLSALEMLVDPIISHMSHNNRVQLAAAVFHLCELYSSATLPVNLNSLTALKEQLEQETDAGTFALEWRIGRSFSWEQAVELAHEAIEDGAAGMSGNY